MVTCGRADEWVKLRRIFIIITNIIISIKNTTENKQRRLQFKQHFLYSAVGARILKSLKLNIITTVADLSSQLQSPCISRIFNCAVMYWMIIVIFADYYHYCASAVCIHKKMSFRINEADQFENNQIGKTIQTWITATVALLALATNWATHQIHQSRHKVRDNLPAKNCRRSRLQENCLDNRDCDVTNRMYWVE